MKDNEFSDSVLAWYAKYGRKLPWRETHDPYKIMVSEFMLQQTQVSRVLPKYLNFIEKFPTVRDLAKAPQSDVLKLWTGLGYNRRAKFLHEAAKAIVEKHNAIVPDDEQQLLDLPGFGSYTTNAILAFAYNKPVVVVDTNIKQIYHRVFALEEKDIRKKIEQTVPKTKARQFYNALMDIASQYYKGKPDLSTYPFKDCAWKNNKPLPQMKKVKQSQFRDSNRFYRGQILKILCSGPLEIKKLELFEPKEKYAAAAKQLEQEQFIQKKGTTYILKN
ncbi:MAG TPA: A/G-specific adenine glycosylase [Acidobacteriota bacterium]|nr:A/G-specific adenine glycosylase [Acidobacteriota bacterium]